MLLTCLNLLLQNLSQLWRAGTILLLRFYEFQLPLSQLGPRKSSLYLAVLWSAKHLGRGYNSVWRSPLSSAFLFPRLLSTFNFQLFCLPLVLSSETSSPQRFKLCHLKCAHIEYALSIKKQQVDRSFPAQFCH